VCLRLLGESAPVLTFLHCDCITNAATCSETERRARWRRSGTSGNAAHLVEVLIPPKGGPVVLQPVRSLVACLIGLTMPPHS
jgi:hypothetical protein